MRIGSGRWRGNDGDEGEKSSCEDGVSEQKKGEDNNCVELDEVGVQQDCSLALRHFEWF